VNPEQQMQETVKLECDAEDCGNSEEDTRAELVEKGWKWNEGTRNGLFRITAAQCPDCNFDFKQVWEDKKQQVAKVHQHESNPNSQSTLEEVNDE
jgi:hypothetical protein